MRLIDADSLIEEINKVYAVEEKEDLKWAKGLHYAKAIIRDMPTIEDDALATMKEQEHLLTEYENLSKVLFKIEKYFKISDLSSLVDGIENGTIIVLQDNGHHIGGTPITETTIKIRRM